MSTQTLWRPTGQAELDLVAAAGYSAWPPRLPDQPIFYPVLNRWYATKIARNWNVPAKGVGYVTSFEVATAFLERYQVHQVGGRDVLEYWIPAADLEELNRHIAAKIVVMAEYRAAVPDAEFEATEAALGIRIPQPWRSWLQAPSWFRQGFLPSGCYLSLYRPSQMVEQHRSWEPAANHPGLTIIGSDGSAEMLALDLRAAVPKVMLVNTVSSGWSDAIPQRVTVEELAARIEDGTFDFRFE